MSGPQPNRNVLPINKVGPVAALPERAQQLDPHPLDPGPADEGETCGGELGAMNGQDVAHEESGGNDEQIMVETEGGKHQVWNMEYKIRTEIKFVQKGRYGCR